MGLRQQATGLYGEIERPTQHREFRLISAFDASAP